MLRHAGIGLILLSFASCTYHGLQVASPTSDDPHFSGIREELERSKRVDVLIVHGMGSPTEGYSDAMMTRVAKALGLTRGDTARTVIDRRHNPRTASVLRTTSFANGSGKVMTVREITWSPVINDIKHMLDYDRTVPTASRRSSTNRALKDGLINARLADPVIYLGAQKAEIQYPIRYTICGILGGTMGFDHCSGGSSTDPSPPAFVIITESLGSRITFDSLMSLRAENDQTTASAVDNLARRTGKIFMLANQLPLLDLASVQPPPDNPEEKGAPADSLAGFLQARQRPQETGTRLVITAMSDPNDLLSYDIPEVFAKRFADDKFINVDIGVSGPGLFRIVSNPLRAHIGFENDPRVIEMIANGY